MRLNIYQAMAIYFSFAQAYQLKRLNANKFMSHTPVRFVHVILQLISTHFSLKCSSETSEVRCKVQKFIMKSQTSCKVNGRFQIHIQIQI